ncbi:MAG TPA: RNA polymerase sigma factor region1.1 domain-containing protein, partial [Verrucomicrobiae bacterium]
MAKTTAKRPAATAKQKDKSRKPDKSHSAKEKESHSAHAAEKEKNSKIDRVAAHRIASAKAAAQIAEGGSPAGNGNGQAGVLPTKEGFDIQEKVKELVRLSKEQGYLTYNDINDALPENIVTGDELDEIYTKLHNLDVEIVDQAEVDVVKQPEPEEEENKEDAKMRLDILDDPVRMYLKQMGQVPLLTREQEVEICKRIEEAENQVRNIIYSFGFTGKEHIALAEKLISEPPKERFDRVIVDKKIDSRDAHLKELRRLVKNVRKLDQDVDDAYAAWQGAVGSPREKKLKQEFLKADARLQRTFPKFFYK